VYFDSIPTTFDGYIDFVSNTHTALAAIAASIDFLDNCVANFTHSYSMVEMGEQLLCLAMLLSKYVYVVTHI